MKKNLLKIFLLIFISLNTANIGFSNTTPEIVRLRSQIKMQTDEIKNLRQALGMKENGPISDLTARVTALQRTNQQQEATLKKQADAFKKQTTELQQKEADLQNVNATLRQQVDDLQRANATLRAENLNCMNERDAMKRREFALKNIIQNANNIFSRIKDTSLEKMNHDELKKYTEGIIGFVEGLSRQSFPN